MSRAYYNEIDRYAAAWLRNLIAEGVIAPGDVDERDIRDVTPGDLAGYTQCHFFAGIGVWSYALRRAGWPDERPVWTGSCPCQPFSSAGSGKGFADERHLWPFWLHLIRVGRPDVVFGEQVASKDGLLWLDLLFDDLQGEGYAFGPQDSCAAGVGAPNIRQRLGFAARELGNSDDVRSRRHAGSLLAPEGSIGRPMWRVVDCVEPPSGIGGLAHADNSERRANCPGGNDGDREAPQRDEGDGDTRQRSDIVYMAHAEEFGCRERLAGPHRRTPFEPERHSAAGVALGDASEQRLSNAELEALLRAGRGSEGRAAQQPGRTFWSDPDWLFCRDSKWRPVEPGTFPLVDGAPARMGRLRAYGNSIVPQLAAEFIGAFMECEP